MHQVRGELCTVTVEDEGSVWVSVRGRASMRMTAREARELSACISSAFFEQSQVTSPPAAPVAAPA